MVLNDAGRIAGICWLEIPTHFPQCVLDEFVVMPNHIHGLIRLLNDTTAAPISHSSNLEAFGRPVAGSIPTIMRSYNGSVTRAIGRKVWQRRFYDVRPRDEAALDGIRTSGTIPKISLPSRKAASRNTSAIAVSSICQRWAFSRHAPRVARTFVASRASLASRIIVASRHAVMLLRSLYRVFFPPWNEQFLEPVSKAGTH